MLDQQRILLLVEDELSLQETLSEQLSELGCTILKARDGREGFQLALTHKPHLILLDIIMPNMDGIEMLDMVRKTAWGAEIPVIILTNVDPGEETMKRIMNLGVSFYFIKSNITPDKLRGTVSDILNKG